MAGSFSSINTALSALRYQQVALDVASTNIANASTDGYVRRRVTGETMGAAAAPAMWSRSTEIGSGVSASRVNRMVDPFLDLRARTEHGKQSFLDLKTAVLSRVETGLAEPGSTGVSAALAGFRSSLHDLANAPGSDAARGQMLGAASTVADAIQLQARQLATESGDQRQKLLVTVDEANVVAADLAATNRSIAVAQLSATDSATLMDSRDRLAMRLSELTGATATTRTDGGLDVSLNGVALVSGQQAGRLRISSGVTATGAADGSPISFTVDPGTSTLPGGPVSGPLQGEAGAIADVLDGVLTQYAADLGTIAAKFADDLNAQHALGVDANGAPGGKLFDYDAADPAGTLAVVITDPKKVAAASAALGGLDATNANAMVDAIKVEDSYQQLVNGFGSQVASVQRLGANQRALTGQVDNSREQLAGVNLDEETVNMLSAQHAYEAAARVMTTLDSVLDTLINRTGVR